MFTTFLALSCTVGGVCFAGWKVVVSGGRSRWLLRRVSPMPLPEVTLTKGDIFASVFPRFGRTSSLVSVRESGSLLSYVSTPKGLGADEVSSLAESVGAGLSQPGVDGVVDRLSGGFGGRVFVKMKTGGLSGFNNSRGASTSEFAQTVAGRSRDVWVGCSVRRAFWFELMAERRQAHDSAEASQLGRVALQSQQGNAVQASMVTLYAGGQSRKEVLNTAMAAAASLPGFGAKRRFRVVSERKTIVWLAGVTVGAAVLSLIAGRVAGSGSEGIPPASLISHLLWAVAGPAKVALEGLSALFAGLCLMAAGRVLPVESERLRRGVERGVLPAPLPWKPSSVVMSPQLFVQMVAPQAGEASGPTVAELTRSVSSALRTGEHLAGESAGAGVFLSSDCRYEGVAADGGTGTGKSVFLRLILGSDLMRRRERMVDGKPRDAIILFESQTESVREIISWCERTGNAYYLSELATANTGPGGLAIDLFGAKRDGAGVVKSLDSRAKAFVAGYKEILDAGEIMSHSDSVLNAVFTLALAVTPAVAAEAGLRWGSPVEFAGVLVGVGEFHMLARPEELSEETVGVDVLLAGFIKKAYLDVRTDDSPFVFQAWKSLFGKGWTDKQRAEAVKAAANKIERLAKARAFFSNLNPQPWEAILPRCPVLIVNTGTALTGETIDPSTARDLAALLCQQLVPAAEAVCSDWSSGSKIADGSDRTVTMFLDELAAFCRNSPTFLSWAKQRARKLGLRLVVGFQDRRELPEGVGTLIEGFGAVARFKQLGRELAQAAVDELNATDRDGGEVSWHRDQLLNLQRGSYVLQYSPPAGSRTTTLATVPWYESDERSVRFAAALSAGKASK
jgi:hypothetical protein